MHKIYISLTEGVKKVSAFWSGRQELLVLCFLDVQKQQQDWKRLWIIELVANTPPTAEHNLIINWNAELKNLKD